MGKFLIFHLILIIIFPIFVLADEKPKSAGWNNLYIIPIYIGFFTLAVLLSIFIRRLRRGALGLNDGQVPVRVRGMDAEEIGSLPSMRFSEIKLHKVAEQGQLECSVCLAEFKDDEVLRLLPDCLHVFHPDCITPWLRSHVTCPVCRASLEHRQGSSLSTSTALEGISGILSSDMCDHHHDDHDDDGRRDGDHVLTVEIEGSVSQHVDLDGTLGERGLGKCYSSGDLAIRLVGEGSSRNSGSNQRSNVGEIDEKSRKSDSSVDYSSLLLSLSHSIVVISD